MKKLLQRFRRCKTIAVLLTVLFTFAFVSGATAGTKNITFRWEQTLSANFGGWILYARQGSSGGGDLSQYTTIATIDYSGNPLPEYETMEIVPSPDGQAIEYFFVLTAFDNEGNESTASNEVSKVIDFESPAAPERLIITIISN